MASWNIYYECLEQGIFYAKESILTIDPCAEIKLIQYKKQSKSNPLALFKKLSDASLKKNSDLYISMLNEDEELLVITLEFSTAVFTEDHELQRADNFLASFIGGGLYLKISPTKKTSSEGGFGGEVKYNYFEPYHLYLKKYGIVAFHEDWPIDSTNSRLLLKDSRALSCPSSKDLLCKVLQESKLYLEEKANFKVGWEKDFTQNLNNHELLDYKKSLEKVVLAKSLSERQPGKKGKVRFQQEEYCPILKRKDFSLFNMGRLGHGMDPNKGIFIYLYSLEMNRDDFILLFHFNRSSKGWYEGSKKKVEFVENILKKEKIISSGDLLSLFIEHQGFPNTEEIYSQLSSSESLGNKIVDLQNYVEKNFNSITSATVRTLIEGTRFLKLVFEDDINQYFDDTILYLDFGTKVPEYNLEKELPSRSNLEARSMNDLGEDDVTFNLIHKTRYFDDKQVIHASYPGAQGDFVVMTGPGRGGSPRLYPDIVAVNEDTLFFGESKQNMLDIKKDILKFNEVLNPDSGLFREGTFSYNYVKNKYGIERDKVKKIFAFTADSYSYFKKNLNSLDLKNDDICFIFFKDSLKYLKYENGKEELVDYIPEITFKVKTLDK